MDCPKCLAAMNDLEVVGYPPIGEYLCPECGARVVKPPRFTLDEHGELMERSGDGTQDG